jgi:Fe-S cluster assembly protein SufB
LLRVSIFGSTVHLEPRRDFVFQEQLSRFQPPEAMATIVRGFVEPIARELPMEYALELNRLIELQMEGAVG